ncbi:MAG: hypothetical protein A2X94_00225 [Bdellovibrionales bacterium GWB1_55_8]|nr:MAG: hypothetical protein A2X94_00225 [Bdellovibrionales bacterium GWB1_55_8]
MSEKGLRWNHPSLDPISRKLGDFGAAFFVLKDPGEMALVWNQASTGLLANARIAGLRPWVDEWTPEKAKAIADKVRQDSVDLVVLKCESREQPILQSLIRQVAELPAALIILVSQLPPGWNTPDSVFDVAVEFEGGTAKIYRKGSTQMSGPEPCLLTLGHARFGHKEASPSAVFAPAALTAAPAHVAPDFPAAVPAQKPRVAAFGLRPNEKVYLEKRLGVTFLPEEQMSENLPADLLLVRGSPKDTRIFDWARIQVSSGRPALALGDDIVRDEDRPKMYAAGFRSVLPRKSTVEEICSAVAVNLPSLSGKKDPVSEWNSEVERLLTQVPHGDKIWKREDREKAHAVYEPILSRQLQRARDLESSAGALILKLPKLPSELQVTGWSKVLQKTLIASLTEALRSHDLSFVVEGYLVVISHSMDRLAARAILKRVAEQLPESAAETMDSRIVDAPAASSTAGQDLFREIFQLTGSEGGTGSR